MDRQQIVITHYAILIGINAYPKDSLKGCVRDVREIEQYLKGTPKPPQIQVFTASSTKDLDSSHQAENLDSSRASQSSGPIESPELWPTYGNVTSSLKEMWSRAKAGNFVYIHYSGHGTTIRSSNEFSNGATGDLALVLLEGVAGTILRYLEGFELANLLRAMVDKGVIVTVVLDCCFSGSVMRDDSSTRYLSYDPMVHAAYCSAAESNFETKVDHPVYRDASIWPNWLVRPDGYTILTACGPTEIAKELRDEKKQQHGVLSYFLLRSLEKLGGVRETQQLIYHNLRARFRETREQRKNEQNPILYGNNTLSFFGPARLGMCSAPVSIIRKPNENGSLQLEAGQAHGICDGDHFIVYPWSSTERDSMSESDPVAATVIRAGALVSDLELSGSSVCVRTGWIATMRSRRSLQAFPIRLDSSLPYRNEWLAALKEQSLSATIDQNGEPVPFLIRLSSENKYEVLDESGSKLGNLPIMMHDQTDTNLICDVMEHLAKFKVVRNLFNNAPANPFQESFSIQIINASGKAFQPGSLVRLKHGEQSHKLELENKGKENLYVYIYDMGPRWQVNRLLDGNHEVIPPGEMFSKRLKMMIPPELREKGHHQCNDTIKVFVTAQSTSFDMLELPIFGESVTRTLATRTGHENGNVLSEDWAALNFFLHTSASTADMDS